MFGSNLKKLRLQKGLSQENVAEKLHVVRQTISKWESGLSAPSAEQLISLSIVLDTPPNLLLGIDNNVKGKSHTILSPSEYVPSSIDDSLAAVKKKEMITSITNRLENMNETGVSFLFDFIKLVPDKEQWMASTSQERIAELKDIEAQRNEEAEHKIEKDAKEAEEAAQAKKNQIYFDHARMFNAIKTIDIPTRYDLSIAEIRAIDFVCGGIRRCFPEYAYSVACKYFKYGFVKGSRYATAQAKKKQKQRILSTIDRQDG